MSQAVGITRAPRYAQAAASFARRLWSLVKSIMSVPTELLAWLQHATYQGSRSTALVSLGWPLTLISACLLGCLYAGRTDWIAVVLAVTLVFAIGAYFAAFFILLFKNPDSLRSEKYLLRKLEIQQGMKGDDLVGLKSKVVDLPPTVPALPGPDNEAEGKP